MTTMNFERAEGQRRTVERLFRGINEERRQIVPGVYAPDAVIEDCTWGVVMDNLKDHAEFGDSWIASLGHYHMELVEFFTSGKNGAVTWVVSFDVPRPKGDGEQRVSMRGILILEFTPDNLIRRETAYQDVNALRRQLALPAIDMSDLGERLGNAALVGAAPDALAQGK